MKARLASGAFLALLLLTSSLPRGCKSAQGNVNSGVQISDVRQRGDESEKDFIERRALIWGWLKDEARLNYLTSIRRAGSPSEVYHLSQCHHLKRGEEYRITIEQAEREHRRPSMNCDTRYWPPTIPELKKYQSELAEVRKKLCAVKSELEAPEE